ncbi:heavy metal-binding protein [Virgibacillus profundi]|uniref:Heavy metal-binding protein n=1 Tax=Virgibacillus profundi TaxID=2024555 RepID=A0A2A2IFJ1_9BACI|nr:heavy-metal-associated domain-containing protein [Virgibacillus profundi]PAV30539.1 heavy metal-binding protein [Virgibacillus profundi]PXY54711.1 copper chaperone [Virgibacillus profundi]
MTTIKFQLEPLTCPSCIKKIEGKLGKMNGVEEAKVMFNSSKVKATFNTEQVTAEELQEIIEKLGYPVLSSKTA